MIASRSLARRTPQSAHSAVGALVIGALVIGALVIGAPSRAEAAFVTGPRSVGTFYSQDDGALHAIIGKDNGDIVEVFWWDNAGLGQSVIAHFDNIAAVSGYWSAHDGFRHAIVAQHNGDLWDVRFHPAHGIFPTKLTSLAGWGDIKSVVGWTDPQRHTNVAFLTRWGSGNVLGVYQQDGGAQAKTYLIDLFRNDVALDLAAHHEVWNATNMVAVAVGASGAPSQIKQIYWQDHRAPDDFFDIFPNTNTQWATNFPGPNQPAQSIVSLSGSDQFCFFCPQWSGREQLQIMTAQNQLKTFDVVNGGGVLFQDWLFTYGPATRSVAGPLLSRITGGNVRRHTLVAMSNGDLWDMFADASTGTPSWRLRMLGKF